MDPHPEKHTDCFYKLVLLINLTNTFSTNKDISVCQILSYIDVDQAIDGILTGLHPLLLGQEANNTDASIKQTRMRVLLDDRYYPCRLGFWLMFYEFQPNSACGVSKCNSVETCHPHGTHPKL